MSNETPESENIVLEHLRRIRSVQDHQSRRLDELKSGQTLIRGDIQHLSGHVFHQEYRIASLEAKMDTVFRRLEISDDSDA